MMAITSWAVARQAEMTMTGADSVTVIESAVEVCWTHRLADRGTSGLAYGCIYADGVTKCAGGRA